MQTAIWYLLPEVIQEGLRRRLPKAWQPPRDTVVQTRVAPAIESLEEIDHLMRQKPHHHQGKGYVAR
jgi:hypothetical protein